MSSQADCALVLVVERDPNVRELESFFLSEELGRTPVCTPVPQ